MSYIQSYINQCCFTNEIPDQNFINFMNVVELKVKNKIDFYLLDLPDEMYRDMFDEGYTSEQVANLVIKNFLTYQRFS